MKKLFASALAALAATALLTPAGATTIRSSAERGPADNCSWGTGTDPDTVNVAYPDLDAHYWSYRYEVVAGTHLKVTGRYPKARYFSFHVYTSGGAPIDSLYDKEIWPDKGSSNPFKTDPAPGDNDRYTLYVEFGVPPDRPEPNTIYTGEITTGYNAYGTLMLRTYVPQDTDSPQGSVPFPAVTWETTDGDVIAERDPCATGQDREGSGTGLNDIIATADYPDLGPRPNFPNATNPPTWTKAQGNQAVGLYGNQQNAYLTARISREHGDVVVIHAKAPTFPDTLRGEAPYLKTQVRYWSICENNVSTRVISCAADYRAPIRNGHYTYVISDPADRPKNATKANGVTWVPWGGTFPDGTLILRNMLPAPSFGHAVQDIEGKKTPPEVMGDYYPTTVYCTTQIFEQTGWQGCFKA